ncbi:bifunctional DNA primase/polymerase [Microbacterium lacticum]|uniref:bifunctional DNA primase/polymerase n=1 Tax=Microbacterium lacticum TaxID=33885 RepID=UPI003A8BB885
MDIAALSTEAAGLLPARAAAVFATAGVPVFPCAPSQKRPLTSRGFHDATTDPAQVAAWWRRWPTANLGMPTGAMSGVEVVDVDYKPGGSGFVGFGDARAAGLVTGWFALVRTPSGGMHAYFPADPDRSQSSWQAARAHVDFRGDGGYVVVPPSTVATDGGTHGSYTLLAPGARQAGPVDAAALRDFLDPRPQHRAWTGEASRMLDAGRLVGWVAALSEGERNRGLFWAACRLAEAGVAPGDAWASLAPAAEHAGLGVRETSATIRSAYRTTHPMPPREQSAGLRQHEPPRRARPVTRQVLS